MPGKPSALGTHLLCELGKSLNLSEHPLSHFQGGRKHGTHLRELTTLVCEKPPGQGGAGEGNSSLY